MTTATLNGLSVTSARVTIPAWGCWFAEVSLDGEHTLSGRVTLQVADLTLAGTVLSGGPAKGRSAFRIVAGAAGWGRKLKKKGYANDAGVKLATVLADAAVEAGETLAPVDTSARVGPGWTRPAGPGAALLNLLAPEAWYIDEAGTTRLGARAAGTLPAGVTHGPVDRGSQSVTLASEKIAAILPGIVVDGMTIVDVQHDVDAKAGLRSTVWGSIGGGSSRDLGAMRRIFEQLYPREKFRGFTEYRVVSTEGKRLNLQPVQVSLGMPDLTRVPMRPGVAGCEAEVADGSRVVVSFVNADPGRAFVSNFEDADGEGYLPTSITFAGGTAGVARLGDEITISSAQILAAGMVAGANPVTIALPLKGTITRASSKVTCG